MSTVTATYTDIAQRAQQHFLRHAALLVTGLSGSSLNTIPHGLPNTPVAVSIMPYSSDGAASTAAPSLDGSNGTYGGGSAVTGQSGFDATNIYVVCGSGVTTCKFVVAY